MSVKFRVIPKNVMAFLWYGVLLVLMFAGAWAGINVLLHGLGPTNLTDLVPWGLWITIDLSSIALSAGAFSLCAVVYLLGIKKYEPVARTATFIGFIGYSMAMLCLLMDIGRPDRFWYGFVFWNPHSVLWEVTMCVGLYFTVLIVETMPIIGDLPLLKRNLPWLSTRLKGIHHFAPLLALFGLAFSLLHQSSLGATYGVIAAKPIWYRPNLSVLFIYSAVLGGISLTLFASMVANQVSGKAKINDHLVQRLAMYLGFGLLGYLYFRFWDSFAMTYTYELGRSEALQMLTRGNLATNFWFGEILLGIIVPAVILLNSKTRINWNWRMLALGLVPLGVVIYRWDLNLIGQLIVTSYIPNENVVRYASYFPSIIEILVGAGVIAYGLFAFSIGVKYFSVVNHYAHHHIGSLSDVKTDVIPDVVGTD